MINDMEQPDPKSAEVARLADLEESLGSITESERRRICSKASTVLGMEKLLDMP